MTCAVLTGSLDVRVEVHSKRELSLFRPPRSTCPLLGGPRLKKSSVLEPGAALLLLAACTWYRCERLLSVHCFVAAEQCEGLTESVFCIAPQPWDWLQVNLGLKKEE
jgi:hypothetical protein